LFVEGRHVVSTASLAQVRFGGTGSVKYIVSGTTPAPFTIANVFVSPGGDIEANAMEVTELLSIRGSGRLSAALGDSINLKSGLVIHLSSEGKKSPYLGLGEIGTSYNIIPSLLRIDFREKELTDSNRFPHNHLLISGRSFGNCETWKELAEFQQLDDYSGMPEKIWDYKLECRSFDGGNGAKTLANDEIGLYVVYDGVGGIDQYLSLIVIVLTLAVLVVGVLAVICAVVIVCRRSKNQKVEAAEPDPTP
jgi:hypothetical protein